MKGWIKFESLRPRFHIYMVCVCCDAPREEWVADAYDIALGSVPNLSNYSNVFINFVEI